MLALVFQHRKPDGPRPGGRRQKDRVMLGRAVSDVREVRRATFWATGTTYWS